MCVISPFTAKCERGFSKMKQIKNSRRNRMEEDILQCLLRLNFFGPTTDTYHPERDVASWLKMGHKTCQGTLHKSVTAVAKENKKN